MRCLRCGKELNDQMVACPYCAQPTTGEKLNQYEQSNNKTNGCAIVGFVCSLIYFAVTFLGYIPYVKRSAWLLGFSTQIQSSVLFYTFLFLIFFFIVEFIIDKGRKQIKENGEKGKGFIVAGSIFTGISMFSGTLYFLYVFVVTEKIQRMIS